MRTRGHHQQPQHRFSRPRRLAVYLALGGAILYASSLLFVYSFQRRLVFDHPEVPTRVDIPGTFALVTSDHETLNAVFLPAGDARRPAVLYLHGNNPSIAQRLPRIQQLADAGFSVLSMDWRGYGGSTGTPSDEGLACDAESAFDWLSARVDPGHIVVFGESLGTGPAVDLATKRAFAGLVLEGGYSSMTDLAQLRYPFFPVRLLLKDRFDSAAKIERIRMPLLQQHGTADATISIALGEKLFARAPEPKTFLRYQGADHDELATRFGSYRDLARFVEDVTATTR